MTDGVRYNSLGPDGRTCPVCFRANGLRGEMQDGHIVACIPGCFARFRVGTGELVRMRDRPVERSGR